MTTALDDFSPPYMGDERITLALDVSQLRVAAFESVLLTVDYSLAAPEGICCPLLLEVQGPSPTSYRRREFLRRAPQFLAFTPQEGGPHLVLLRELAHNRWLGRLRLDVAGDTVQRRKTL